MSDQEIGTAVTRGSYVYLYNNKGNQIASIGLGSQDTLQGYTSGTVSIKRGCYIYIYNSKGQQISTVSAGR
jgi:hypothetical protein